MKGAGMPENELVPQSTFHVEVAETNDPTCTCGKPSIALVVIDDPIEDRVEVFFVCLDCAGMVYDMHHTINRV